MGYTPKIPRRKEIIMRPTVDGTLEELLASLVITESHGKPNVIVWKVGLPNMNYRVALRRPGTTGWIMQTVAHMDPESPTRGFWIKGYVDKNVAYEILFITSGIVVPFTFTGKVKA